MCMGNFTPRHLLVVAERRLRDRIAQAGRTPVVLTEVMRLAGLSEALTCVSPTLKLMTRAATDALFAIAALITPCGVSVHSRS